MGQITLRKTTEREKLVARAEELLGEQQTSKVIDAALRHLIQSADNYESAKDNLTPEQAEQLSTEVVRITMYPQVRTD